MVSRRHYLGLQTLTKQAAIVVSVKTLSSILALGASIMLARYLGPTDYGRYSLILGIGAVLAVPVQFGTPILVLRISTTASADRSWAFFNGIVKFSRRWINFGTLVVFLLGGIVLLVPIWSIASWQILAVSLLVFFNAHSAVRSAAIRGLGNIFASQLPELILRPSLLLLGLIVLVLIGYFDFQSSIAIYLSAAASAYLLGSWLLRRQIAVCAADKSVATDSRQWFKSMLALGFAGAAGQVNGQIDIVFLGALLSPEQVGVYRVALLASLQVAFATWALNAVFAPEFALAYKRESKARMRELLRASVRLMTGSGFVIFALLALFGKSILHYVFGAEYASAYAPMMILATGQIVIVATGPVGSILAMCDGEQKLAKASAVSVLANAILNPLGIFAFGLIGAAVATAASGVLWRILLARYAKGAISTLDLESGAISDTRAAK